MKEQIKKELDKLKLKSIAQGGKIYVELSAEDQPGTQQRVIDACGGMGSIRRWNEVGKAWLIIMPNKAAPSPAKPEPAAEGPEKKQAKK